jgi:hypothetical protein
LSRNEFIEEKKVTRKILYPAGHSGPPLNVNLKSRSKNSLDVSWKIPDKNSQNSELTGYQVCFNTRNATPECLMLQSTKVFSLTLNKLQPSTKYLVTVSAITKAGYGEKSSEVSEITNGGDLLCHMHTVVNTLAMYISLLLHLF